MKKNTEENAWQGDRYARILLENGEKLGENKGFIDILPQVFSCLAGLGANGRAETALKTAYGTLFEEDTGIIKLLSPPFGEEETETIGYIAAYPEGVRENGGQYTHGAIWSAQAFFKMGESEKGAKIMLAQMKMRG